jgi:leader peptidase (prepilin peptidase)/N-methyltransferase
VSLLLGALLGLSVGSFANVFLYRFPKGLSLFRPGSRCPHCGHPVRWQHNLPVLGWLILRGRCRDCGEPIAASYPLVEAAFGIVGSAVVLAFGPSPATWYYLPFFLLLLLAAWVDWRTQYLYNALTGPMALLGLGASFAFPELLGGRWQSPLAMAAMALTMQALLLLGRWVTGRDEALGGGDVRLMAAAAGFLGFPHAWAALLLGSFLGLPSLWLYRRLHGGTWKDPAPFGPALCLACAVAACDRLSGTGFLIQFLGFGPL